MFVGHISSDIEELNRLHEIYYWIPNEYMIRPTDSILQEKDVFSKFILEQWHSYKDYILDTHFFRGMSLFDNRLRLTNPITESEWFFSRSSFPYDLAEGVNHYVLWNCFYDYYFDFKESVIDTIIKDTLGVIIGSEDFDFAWYKNPKPSIPELWHVQVFWIRI
jgi:hypothetical protein